MHAVSLATENITALVAETTNQSIGLITGEQKLLSKGSIEFIKQVKAEHQIVKTTYDKKQATVS